MPVDDTNQMVVRVEGGYRQLTIQTLTTPLQALRTLWLRAFSNLCLLNSGGEPQDFWPARRLATPSSASFAAIVLP